MQTAGRTPGLALRPLFGPTSALARALVAVHATRSVARRPAEQALGHFGGDEQLLSFPFGREALSPQRQRHTEDP